MTSIGALARFGSRPEGLSRFEPGRDLRPVIGLLEIGFQNELEARDRRWLEELADLGGANPVVNALSRYLPSPTSTLGGYVWYAEGRLVGNVSVMRCSRDVWVIANVVTHPAYRRRGLGRRLMAAALEALERRGARQVQLQVRSDNAPALRLYETLGFWHMNTATTLRLDSARGASRFIRPLRQGRLERLSGRRDWRRGRRLLARSGDLDRGGPTGLALQAIEHHWLWDGLEDWLQGRHRAAWALTMDGEFRAIVATLGVNRHGPHRIELAVDPVHAGQVEAVLIDVALDALAPLEPFEIDCEVNTLEREQIAALEQAGFKQVRTLDRLAVDLGRLRPPR